MFRLRSITGYLAFKANNSQESVLKCVVSAVKLVVARFFHGLRLQPCIKQNSTRESPMLKVTLRTLEFDVSHETT